MDTIKRQRKRRLKTKEIVIKVSDEGAPRFPVGMECRTETGLNCIGGSKQLKPPLRAQTERENPCHIVVSAT